MAPCKCSQSVHIVPNVQRCAPSRYTSMPIRIATTHMRGNLAALGEERSVPAGGSGESSRPETLPLSCPAQPGRWHTCRTSPPCGLRASEGDGMGRVRARQSMSGSHFGVLIKQRHPGEQRACKHPVRECPCRQTAPAPQASSTPSNSVVCSRVLLQHGRLSTVARQRSSRGCGGSRRQPPPPPVQRN